MTLTYYQNYYSKYSTEVQSSEKEILAQNKGKILLGYGLWIGLILFRYLRYHTFK